MKFFKFSVLVLISINFISCTAQKERVPANELAGSQDDLGFFSNTSDPVTSLRPQARPSDLDTSSGTVDYNARPLFVPSGLGANCTANFVTENRTYGPLAQHLIQRFKNMENGVRRPGEPSPEHFNRFFLNDSSQIAETCPKYNSMNPTERMHFWVWTFMLISYKESQCNDPRWRLNANDVNGPSVCAYQMPEFENGRRPSWRGPGCDVDNDGRVGEVIRGTRYETGNIESCTSCAIEAMGRGLCGFHSPPGGVCNDPPIRGVFGSQMFWQEMKRPSGNIVSILRNYRGCR